MMENTKRISFIAVVIFCLSGCSSKHYINKYTNGKEVFLSHVIEIDKKGSLETHGFTADNLDVENKELKYSRIEQGIKSHLNSGKKKIMIFIHGGLNSPTASFKRALEDTKEIKEDDIYPIFVNWHSGAISSYFQQAFHVSGGVEYKALKVPAFPFILASDILIGYSNWPRSTFNNGASNLLNVGEYDAYGKTWSRTRKNSVALYKAHNEMQNNSVKMSWGADERKAGKSFLSGAHNVLFTPLRLFTTPIWDGLGRQAWMNMKRRSHALIHPAREFDVRDSIQYTNALENLIEREKTGVLVDFIDRLKRTLDKKDTSDYELILIGHSMGTMVVNDIILEYPDLKIDEIVYMGAACSINEMRRSIFPYLSQNKSTNFYNLMLHPVSENREHMFFGTELILPSGSLLNHIDNMFEQTSDFMERTAGKWENMIQTTHLIPTDIRDQIQLKSFIGKNNKKPLDEKDIHLDINENIQIFQPQKHGQFDDEKYWAKSFWSVSED